MICHFCSRSIPDVSVHCVAFDAWARFCGPNCCIAYAYKLCLRTHNHCVVCKQWFINTEKTPLCLCTGCDAKCVAGLVDVQDLEGVHQVLGDILAIMERTAQDNPNRPERKNGHNG